MDRLFSGLRGILFCIKDRNGRYLCANDAFLRRARIVRDGETFRLGV